MSAEKFDVIGYLEKGLNNKYNLRFNIENKTMEFKEVENECWQQTDKSLRDKIDEILIASQDEAIYSIVQDFLSNGPNDYETIGDNSQTEKDDSVSTNQTVSNAPEKMPLTGLIHGIFYTAKYLLDKKISNIPYLLEGIFQKYGLVAVTGSSDVGKSSFIRQFAIDLVTGSPSFLGFKLIPEHKKVLYVSTEDDEIATSYLAYKQVQVHLHSSNLLHNLGFIFNTDKLLKDLDYVLNMYKVDCVIIDTLADLYSGDMNQANKIRSFIYQYQKLADKYKTLFIFLHHTKKGAQYTVPSKDNVLGSQGFEAKMRMVLELRKDPENPELRYLSIVKGNYVPETFKNEAMVLKFDNNLRFSNLNRTIPISKLGRSDNYRKKQNKDAKDRAIEIKRTENLSVNKIQQNLFSEGYKIGRSTIAKWISNDDISIPIDYCFEDPEELIPDFDNTNLISPEVENNEVSNV